jgi:esterase
MAVTLAHAEHGVGPPVVILHGLFGAGTNWTMVARRLGERFRVVTVDLRNHGASPWAMPMDYPAMAEDVAAFIAAQGLGSAAVIGHSMGGKVAMVLALTAPELVTRLVVVDIAPVARPTSHLAFVEAMLGVDLKGLNRRSVADAALRPALPNDAERQFLLQNLVAGQEGFHWRLNLPAIRDAMPQLSGFPPFDAAAAYRGPTLVIRGGNSNYVRDRDLPAFARLFPAFELVTIAGATHWVHAERTEEFLAAVTPFLAAA